MSRQTKEAPKPTQPTTATERSAASASICRVRRRSPSVKTASRSSARRHPSRRRRRPENGPRPVSSRSGRAFQPSTTNHQTSSSSSEIRGSSAESESNRSSRLARFRRDHARSVRPRENKQVQQQQRRSATRVARPSGCTPERRAIHERRPRSRATRSQGRRLRDEPGHG
jgi:hypothetical protein